MAVRDKSGSQWTRLTMGLAILAFGFLMWLDHLGRIEASVFLEWWPLALLVVAIGHVLDGRWAAAVIWTLLGVWFVLPLLGYSRLPLWRLMGVWPLLITAAGLTLVWHSLRPAVTIPGPGAFQAFAFMGGNVRSIGSQNFSGGEAIAVMAGCEVDLSLARMSGEAVIDVLAFWGGIEILVPRGWQVVSRVTPIVGGYANYTAAAPESAPRLVLRGTSIMGGIEVRNPRESGS